MKDCMKLCVACELTCKVKECRYWIDYDEDLNCALIAIEKNGPMTLQKVSDRLGISLVRVKQIQDKVIKKLSKNIKREQKSEL
tara:strand:+ start:106 stop:354 length:249 start_codon:yes stop_codon:yes gene_type:complete